MVTSSCVPPATPPHLAMRRKTGWPIVTPYQICTLTHQNNWVEERAEAQYLRSHRRKPLSQLRDKFQTTYRETYCKNPPPVIRTQKNFEGTGYPHHQPILDTLRYQDEYLKPTSIHHASDIDPRNVSEICPDCKCPTLCDCLSKRFYSYAQWNKEYDKTRHFNSIMQTKGAQRSACHVPSFFPY